jgi:anti-sigma factor RsiW
MYEDEAGQRVTFLIVAAHDGRESSLQFAQLDSLRSFLWTDETVRCVLVGSMARARLRDIATLAYEQLG